MIYSDFVVSFESPNADGIPIDVVSPAGAGRALVKSLPSLQHTRNLLPGLWRDVALADELLPEPLALRSVGRELFRSIFSGEVISLFEECLTYAEKNNGGLRIKLVFDLFPSSDSLHALPWEFLYWSEKQAFVALSRFTPVVRFVRLPREPAATPITKLRVLLVAPSPIGASPLTILEECEKIRRALAPLPDVEIFQIDRPTILSVRQALLEQEINVLHFAGMSGYDHMGKAILLFEKSDGTPDRVGGDELALILNGAPGMRLVFLNACDTAKTIGRAEPNPFRSTALALVASGVPAVIGMQFPIEDQAAFRFSELFYQRLAMGDPIEAAVTQGRQAAYARDPDTMEWGTPVLFSRMAAGELFNSARENARYKRRLSVFLCHAVEDKEFVRQLYRRLTVNGYDVWIDEERILPGKPWETEITRALRSSDVVIVCLSKKAITKTGFVQKEVAMALDELQQQPEGMIYLIPVKIEECATPERLKHLHFVRIDDEAGYLRLLASLGERKKDLSL